MTQAKHPIQPLADRIEVQEIHICGVCGDQMHSLKSTWSKRDFDDMSSPEEDPPNYLKEQTPEGSRYVMWQPIDFSDCPKHTLVGNEYDSGVHQYKPFLQEPS
jgi:hypothetical protein